MFRDDAARLAGLAGALLGWRPDEFWPATPSELAAVLAAMAPGGGDSVSPGELQRLMERFPDAEAGQALPLTPSRKREGES